MSLMPKKTKVIWRSLISLWLPMCTSWNLHMYSLLLLHVSMIQYVFRHFSIKLACQSTCSNQNLQILQNSKSTSLPLQTLWPGMIVIWFGIHAALCLVVRHESAALFHILDNGDGEACLSQSRLLLAWAVPRSWSTCQVGPPKNLYFLSCCSL